MFAADNEADVGGGGGGGGGGAGDDAVGKYFDSGDGLWRALLTTLTLVVVVSCNIWVPVDWPTKCGEICCSIIILLGIFFYRD